LSSRLINGILETSGLRNAPLSDGAALDAAMFTVEERE
jgi:hypothetical protein